MSICFLPQTKDILLDFIAIILLNIRDRYSVESKHFANIMISICNNMISICVSSVSQQGLLFAVRYYNRIQFFWFYSIKLSYDKIHTVLQNVLSFCWWLFTFPQYPLDLSWQWHEVRTDYELLRNPYSPLNLRVLQILCYWSSCSTVALLYGLGFHVLFRKIIRSHILFSYLPIENIF